VALVTVFLHLFTIFTGVFLLARAGFRVSLKWSLVAAFLVSTQPLLVGVFLTSWWVVSLGIGAFAWAAGALLWAAHDPRPLRVLVLGVTTLGVFASGWPHSWLAFAATCILVAIYTAVVSRERGVRRFRTASVLAGSVLLGSIAAIPCISEYIALSRAGLLSRGSAFNNAGNFLTPTIGQLLGFANPSSGDFFNNFAGYSWIPIPIGFVTLLFWVAIFFTKHTRALWRSDRLLQLLAVTAALFYVCTQLPSQFGPTRWSFRYIPYAAMFMAVGCAYYLAKTRRIWSRARFGAAAVLVVVSAMTGAWKVPDPADHRYSLLTPSIFAIGTIVVLGLYKRAALRRWLDLALVVLAAVIVALQIPASGAFFHNEDKIPSGETGARVRTVSAGGFVFDAISGLRPNDWAPGFSSGRYGIFDIELVNNYDPVGHAALIALLPSPTGHGFQKPAALAVLSQPAPAPFGDVCMFDVMRVTAVFTHADPQVGEHAALAHCGFSMHSTRGQTALFTHPRPGSDPDSTVSVSTPGTRISDDQLVNAQVERVHVSNTTGAEGRVAFARVWWPGYSATIDGRPVATQSINGLFVSAAVPAGVSGTLELSYYPSTWGWALPLSLGGVVLLILLCAWIGLWRRRKSRAVAQ